MDKDSILYLDMDDVLAEFKRAACIIHGYTGEEPELQVWELPAAMGISNTQFWAPLDNYSFWVSLKECPWAETLMKKMRKCFGSVVICSSPSHSSSCYAAKVDWLRARRWYKGEDIILMSHKERLAKENTYLLDDRQENVISFVSAGGTGLLFPQPWNISKTQPTKRIVASLCRVVKKGVLRREKLNAKKPRT